MLQDSLKELFHPPDMKMKYESKVTSNISDVVRHAKQLMTYYSPISKSLDILAFAIGNEVKLFIKYIKSFLKPIQVESISPTVDEDSPTDIEGGFNGNKRKLTCLYSAIVSAQGLVRRIVYGTAIIDDIQVICSDDLAGINLNHESECFKLYSKWQGYTELPQVDIIGKAYIATVELFQAKDHLIQLHNVLNQFELRKIVESSESSEINLIANQMYLNLPEKRREFTVLNAIEKYQFVCNNLCMEEGSVSKTDGNRINYTVSNHKCFRLFEAYEQSMVFFRYAKERGFTGSDGTRKFKEQHQLVTEELLHENIFHDTIMDHLLGTFQFFEPLFQKPNSLKKLMSIITQFSKHHIETAIEQIKTVNKNISLIRLWFDTSEVSFFIR